MAEFTSGGVGFDFDIGKYLSGIQGVTGSDTGGITGSDESTGSDFNIDKYVSHIQAATGSDTGGITGSGDVPSYEEQSGGFIDGLLGSLGKIGSTIGTDFEKMVSDPKSRSELLKLAAGGVLTAYGQNKLLDKKLDADKEILKVQNNYLKKKEEREQQRAQHAPVKSEDWGFDTGILAAAMKGKK